MDARSEPYSVLRLAVGGLLAWGTAVMAAATMPFPFIGCAAFLLFPLALGVAQLPNVQLSRLHSNPASARAALGLMTVGSICATVSAASWATEAARRMLASQRRMEAGAPEMGTVLLGSLGMVGAILYGLALRDAPKAGWGPRLVVPLAALALSPASAAAVHLLRGSFVLTA